MTRWPWEMTPDEWKEEAELLGHQHIHCSRCGYHGWSDDTGHCPRCDAPRAGEEEQT